jgi:hypothetical protein
MMCDINSTLFVILLNGVLSQQTPVIIVYKMDVSECGNQLYFKVFFARKYIKIIYFFIFKYYL